MSAPKPLFTGVVDEIVESLDIQAPIASESERSCEFYPGRFAHAAKVEEENGNQQLAAIYRFLGLLVGFRPTYEVPDSPYSPVPLGEGRRSPIPSDLTPNDVGVLERLAPLAKDPALRARLYDVLWILKKDHHACAEAADCYLIAAGGVDSPDHWPHASPSYQRALQLAGKIGRDKPLYQKISTAIQDVVRRIAGESEAFRARNYLQLIRRYRCGNPAEFAAIAEGIATAVVNDPYRARAYWEVASDLWHDAKNTEREKDARLAAARTYIVEAESRMLGQMPSALTAAGLLADGIEALRRAGEAKEKIESLRKRLSEIQQASTGEMKTFSMEMPDISAPIESAREHVRGHDLLTALMRFALGYDLTDCADLKKTVLKNANDFPMQHFFGASVVDSKGRVIKQRPGMFGLSGEEFEKRLLEEMFSYATQFMWPLRVATYIEPARVQIYNDHHLGKDDLASLITNNPFVPPGHEGIFLRGIVAGFHGDFLVAAHLLVPQIENSLRYVLESNSVDVSNLKSDGTQPVKVLGAIFDMKETAEILGESLCFELRGCLIEKTGYDFRNRVAHGFISEAECYSSAASYIWWLVLRICLFPIFQAMVRRSGGIP
jgi:hypothetical protein